MSAAPEHAQRQENAEIGRRDHPDEMPAHPIKVIRIEQPLAEHDRGDLEQSRDQPAPGRKTREVRRARAGPAPVAGGEVTAGAVSSKTLVGPMVIASGYTWV